MIPIEVHPSCFSPISCKSFSPGFLIQTKKGSSQFLLHPRFSRYSSGGLELCYKLPMSLPQNPGSQRQASLWSRKKVHLPSVSPLCMEGGNAPPLTSPSAGGGTFKPDPHPLWRGMICDFPVSARGFRIWVSVVSTEKRCAYLLYLACLLGLLGIRDGSGFQRGLGLTIQTHQENDELISVAGFWTLS